MNTSAASVTEDLFRVSPFSMDAETKNVMYAGALSALTRYHYERSPEFRRATRIFGYQPSMQLQAEDIPFIPVRLFKEYELLSVDRGEIVKTLTSSGTSGQAVSKILLDRLTAQNQTRALVQIVSSFTGGKRLPFLIVDSPSVMKDRTSFSARGAGILGFAMLGHDPTYLLDENYQIDFARLDAFAEKHKGGRILLFGFTFMVWKYLCDGLRKAGRSLQMEGILIHGGGWKKLMSIAVDNATFKKAVGDISGISTVCNYYGMVEQTGSIFMECPQGVLHASIYSDIIVRDPLTFSAMRPVHAGLLQLVSLLPTSYPGHSLLSEDIGEILGVDDCPCGRKGKYFRVLGRVQHAELRGCSDVYPSLS